MDDLVMWFGEQLDEDERVALYFRDEAPHGVADCGEAHGDLWYQGRMVVDGARVLAEVEAKRAILDDFRGSAKWADERLAEGKPDAQAYAMRAGGLLDVIRLLAEPYRERPGYRPEWAPER